MFTGIIEEAGRIVSVSPAGDGRRLLVDAGRLAADIRPGDSLAVDGVCLTAEEWNSSKLSAPPTLKYRSWC